MWVVGSQITPGTYRATAAYGCYWERMRHFQGTTGGIIANDFVSSAGQQLVQISPSDAGFQSNSACGTWTPVSSAIAGAPLVVQTPSEIAANHQKNRQRSGAR